MLGKLFTGKPPDWQYPMNPIADSAELDVTGVPPSPATMWNDSSEMVAMLCGGRQFDTCWTIKTQRDCASASPPSSVSLPQSALTLQLQQLQVQSRMSPMSSSPSNSDSSSLCPSTTSARSSFAAAHGVATDPFPLMRIPNAESRHRGPILCSTSRDTTRHRSDELVSLHTGQSSAEEEDDDDVSPRSDASADNPVVLSITRPMTIVRPKSVKNSQHHQRHHHQGNWKPRSVHYVPRCAQRTIQPPVLPSVPPAPTRPCLSFPLYVDGEGMEIARQPTSTAHTQHTNCAQPSSSSMARRHAKSSNANKHNVRFADWPGSVQHLHGTHAALANHSPQPSNALHRMAGCTTTQAGPVFTHRVLAASQLVVLRSSHAQLQTEQMRSLVRESDPTQHQAMQHAMFDLANIKLRTQCSLPALQAAKQVFQAQLAQSDIQFRVGRIHAFSHLDTPCTEACTVSGGLGSHCIHVGGSAPMEQPLSAVAGRPAPLARAASCSHLIPVVPCPVSPVAVFPHRSSASSSALHTLSSSDQQGMLHSNYGSRLSLNGGPQRQPVPPLIYGPLFVTLNRFFMSDDVKQWQATNGVV